MKCAYCPRDAHVAVCAYCFDGKESGCRARVAEIESEAQSYARALLVEQERRATAETKLAEVTEERDKLKTAAENLRLNSQMLQMKNDDLRAGYAEAVRDVVAYCKKMARRSGLPVRKLSISMSSLLDTLERGAHIGCAAKKEGG